MQPTDVRKPDYFHKVVDCQWGCPAHTNVPEYIRLIAQGRYSDAYMLNRESNVFPGVLGRTCDRPCEPARRANDLLDRVRGCDRVGLGSALGDAQRVWRRLRRTQLLATR